MARLYDFSATRLSGAEQMLEDHRGKVVLVVNTASQCGFTPQYAGLEELYVRFAEQGFVVLGFPCDQFGAQEPGTDDEIADFCHVNYGVSFPMFSKIDVNGSGAHPLYDWLKSERKGILGGAIKWNFTKFLVDRDGHVVSRYAPTTEPADIADDIEKLLDA